MRAAPSPATLLRPALRALAACGLLLLAAGCSEGPAVKAKPPYLAASLDSIDFGEVVVGESDKRALYLINKGDMAVELTAFTGDMIDGVFSVVPVGSSIDPDDDVVVHLIFQPKAAKSYETVLTISNSSVNEPEFKLTLKGGGKAPDPCKGVVCNSPPGRLCLNSRTARVYNPVGRCAEGACVYEPIDEECPQFGCDAETGMCAEDPCWGVSCQRPPNGCFHTQGLCQNGACTYTVNNDVSCDDSNPCTLGDTCSDGGCRGTPKVCDQPPPQGCIASNTLRRYDPQGACSQTGACDYHPTDITCQFGCENGACKGDPCAGGCDDGNPCTTDFCQAGVGCKHSNADGASCVAASADCPTGVCAAGQCLSKPDVTCTAEYDMDLCMEAKIAGKCTARGECVVTSPPPQYQCPGCNGICLKCFFFQYCIPF